MVKIVAKALYDRQKNEFMPSWDNAPSIWARGCLNDAHEILQVIEVYGMRPPIWFEELDERKDDGFRLNDTWEPENE